MTNFLQHLSNVVAFYTLQHRSENATRQYQEKRLRKLVRSFYQYTPLYRNLLLKQNIVPEDIQTIADMHKLPILSKETFLGHEVESYVNNAERVFGEWKKTSGTSGKPFTFLSSRLSTTRHASRYLRFKFLSALGMSLQKIWNLRVVQLKMRSGSADNTLFVPVRDFLADPSRALLSIAAFKPDIIESYSSTLRVLADAVHDSSATLHIPYIVSFGERLSPPTRQHIETALSGEVFDRYGTEELGVIGVECAEHRGFHITTESLIMEIVDDQGRVVPPGHYGRVIGTDFLNYNMPFVRYDTGDHGVMRMDACECGLRTPRIWVEGRYTTSLLINGKIIHHLEFDAALDGFMHHIYQYQVAKRSENSVLVRVIPGNSFDTGSIEKIRQSIQALVGNTEVLVETIHHIPLTPMGKSRILVDET